MSNVIKFPNNELQRFLDDFEEVEAAMIDALHNGEEFNTELARVTLSALINIMANYYQEEDLIEDVYSMIKISYSNDL